MQYAVLISVLLPGGGAVLHGAWRVLSTVGKMRTERRIHCQWEKAIRQGIAKGKGVRREREKRLRKMAFSYPTTQRVFP